LTEKKLIKDKIFLDTNIIVYLYSSDEPEKKAKIETIIESFEKATISTQVINEFLYVMHKKRNIPVAILAKSIDELIEAFALVYIALPTIKHALLIAHQYKYTYFDSLILASALEHDCTLLFTEDMHHTHMVENKLKILNPF
jgi:predicted nucleic acid-binding protein